MKQIKNIFSVVCICLSMVCVIVPSFAADNGCDDENNDRVTPELALCSTHAYNIGVVQNPTNASDKQLMKDVVALKATVMTQQMNKQYEYLEAMIRRFKTQLEKAVLTTKLQSAGASTSSSSSSSGGGSYRSEDRNIHMAGVKNCMNFYQDSEILKCYEDNLNTIINQSGNGDTVNSELKKQLVQDFCALDDIEIGDSKKDSCIGQDKLPSEKLVKAYCDGTEKAQTLSKKDFQTVIDRMRSCLQNKYRAYNNSQKDKDRD